MRLYAAPIVDPLADVPAHELDDFFRTLASTADDTFKNALTSLNSALATIDPFQLLATLAFYGLTVVDPYKSEWDQDHPILQHHIEIAQALTLSHRAEDLGTKPLHPFEISNIHALLRELATSYAMKRTNAINSASDSTVHRKLASLERIRLHTQSVRNWGEIEQIVATSRKLFTPLDAEFQTVLGATASDIIAMWLAIVELTECRMVAHANALESFVKASTLSQAADAYCETFPGLAGNPQELLAIADEQSLTDLQFKMILLGHSDLRLRDIFWLTTEEIANATPSRSIHSMLPTILDKMSLELGSLHGRDVEHLLLDNPIWNRPLMRVNEGQYFVPIPTMAISFMIPMLEGLIRGHDGVLQRYYRRRADYLEEATADLLQEAFPNSEMVRNAIWIDPDSGDECETDVILKLDSHLLIVEAKGGRVAEPARRGAERTLQRAISDLVEAPSRQSQQLANILSRSSGHYEFRSRRGGGCTIDTSAIRHIVRLNVVLDQLGDLHTSSLHLLDAGLLPPDVHYPPTMLLADLEAVLQYLDGVPQRLHYLRWRTEVETEVRFTGDEIDLLGCYVIDEFQSVFEFGDGGLIPLGLSETIDGYHRLIRYGLDSVQKPCRQFTDWWRSLIDHLEARQFAGWSEMVVDLISVPYRLQVKLEREFAKTKRNVLRFWESPTHINTQVLTTRTTALALFAYRGTAISRDRRNELLTNAGHLALKGNVLKRAMVIGVDVDRLDIERDGPYSVLVWVLGTEEPRLFGPFLSHDR